jgi:hypothetical protein
MSKTVTIFDISCDITLLTPGLRRGILVPKRTINI